MMRVYGCGVGLQGNSYAIPTKDENVYPLPYNIIEVYVNQFIEFSERRFDLTFRLVKIGCGLAGLDEERMKAMFFTVSK